MGLVKTTIELPDPLFRRAKAAAAERGRTLKDFFAEALQERLVRVQQAPSKNQLWETSFGALKHLHRETLRIEKIIEDAFETIDEEEWR
jgi:hypothetical protein